jgi:fibronectin-binding autotransporter adhesin
VRGAGQLGLAILAAGAVALILQFGAASAFPGANGKIVFVRGGSLWTMNADGSSATNLGVAGANPTWSPSAGQIAFDDGTSIFKVNPDGTGLTGALVSGTKPAWSPDGGQIAYQTGGGISRIPSGGGAATVVVAAGSDPAWSPDGTKIAYGDSGDVKVVTVSGGAVTNLTNSSGGSDSDPTWSPDGAKIGFVSDAFGPTEILVMSGDGSGQARLTTNSLTESAPSWSPDGSQIAFSDGGDIRTVPATGGGASTQVTSDASVDVQPDWGVGFSIAITAIAEGVIDGSIKDGETLTAGSVTSSGAGTATGSPTYQWLRCNSSGGDCVSISGATGETYTVTSTDVSSTIRVRATVDSTAGPASATSAAVGPVVGVAPSNTSLPTITGALTATLGTALTATTGTWSGTTPISYSYSWSQCDATGGSCTPISGATSSTYTPVTSDLGKTLRVQVTATNGFVVGAAPTATSNQTAVVVSNIPTNTAVPVVTGTTRVGFSLSTTTGTWSGAPTITFKYQWQRCNSTGGACSNIVGAISSFYLISNADVGSRLRVEVTGTNTAGSAKAVSEPTTLVEGQGPLNSVSPVITGSARTGQTLRTSNGTWTGSTPITFTYQWRRCNAAGAACVAIGGATSNTYVVAAADVGSRLLVSVTATNGVGSATENSDPTEVVVAGTGTGGATRPANTRRPSFIGVLARGRTLRAVNGTWTGTTPMTFSYQWQRCPATGTECTAIPLATRSTYVLTAADVNRRIRLQVTGANAAGSAQALSVISARVAARAPAAAKGKTIRGNARANRLIGTNFADTIFGGRGNDTINPRQGRDRVFAGAGNDTVNAADGVKDTIDCGTGTRDRVTADRIDVVRKSCERVTRRRR